MKFNGKNLNEVVEAHQRWLHGCLDEPLVEEYSSRADFSHCRLEGRDFHGMNLDKANFKDADLHDCDFSNASLSMAEFNGAELYRCDFGLARLNSSVFIGAKIFDCNFFGANLCSVQFIDANIGYTNFENSMINDHTDFTGAVARHLKDMPYIPMVCPEEGEFVAWKVVCATTDDRDDRMHHMPVLAKLLIPADAKRSSGFGRKCRASKAEVLGFYDLDGHMFDRKFCYSIHSYWHWDFYYEVGKIVEPEESFNEDRWSECASGIHFFMNRREAIEYSKRL
jgi:hypothetical protein